MTDDLGKEPYWKLLQTLLWIGQRDIQLVAKHATHVGQFYPDFQSSNLIAWARRHLADRKTDKTEPVVSSTPDEELKAALLCGDVKASGLKDDKGERLPIPPDAWIDLKLINELSEFNGDAGAFRQGLPKKHPPSFWTHLRFDRASVMRSFRTSAPSAQELPGELANEPKSGRSWARTKANREQASILAKSSEGTITIDGMDRAMVEIWKNNKWEPRPTFGSFRTYLHLADLPEISNT